MRETATTFVGSSRVMARGSGFRSRPVAATVTPTAGSGTRSSLADPEPPGVGVATGAGAVGEPPPPQPAAAATAAAVVTTNSRLLGMGLPFRSIPLDRRAPPGVEAKPVPGGCHRRAGRVAYRPPRRNDEILVSHLRRRLRDAGRAPGRGLRPPGLGGHGRAPQAVLLRCAGEGPPRHDDPRGEDRPDDPGRAGQDRR